MRLRYLERIKTFSDVIFLKNKIFELKSPKDEVDHQKSSFTLFLPQKWYI